MGEGYPCARMAGICTRELTLELPLPPATGDGFPLWPALALAVLSGTVLLIIVTRKKSHSM